MKHYLTKVMMTGLLVAKNINIMRKLILSCNKFYLVLFLFLTIIAHAENTINVAPIFSQNEVTSGDERYFTFMMRTDSVVQSMQIDVKMPIGVRLNCIKWNQDDFSADYHFDYNLIDTEENIYRIIAWSDTKLGTLNDKNTNVFICGYETEEMQDNGIRPVIISNTIFGMDTIVAIYPDKASSFVVFGNENESKACELSDYSSLSGYLPSFVCKKINGILAKDMSVKIVNLQNIDSIGGPIKASNINTLYYTTENTKTLQQLKEHIGANIIYIDNIGNARSESILLAGKDNYYADNIASGFSNMHDVTTESFIFDRTFTTNQWTTMCLPISIDELQLENLKNTLKLKVYSLTSFEAETNKLNFAEVEKIEANTPYLIRFNGVFSELPKITNCTVKPTSAVNDITVEDGVTFCGAFEPSILESNENVTYYGYDAANGIFRKVGKNVKLYPFRAYIMMTAKNDDAPAKLATFFLNEDENTTNITEIRADNEDDKRCYNISGQRVHHNARGIIICNGRKWIN